jgi:hypothetical protein
MAVIGNNPAVAGASGRLGTFYYRQVDGETMMVNMPSKSAERSAKQLEQSERFKDAVFYAGRQMAKPEGKAWYDKKVNRKFTKPFKAAVSDYMVAPKIEAIQLQDYTGEPGGMIRVRATDNFKVASVSVTITDAESKVIEQGEAQPWGKKGLWRLTTGVRNPNLIGTVVNVVAKDYPGNTTKKSMIIEVMANEEINGDPGMKA